MPIECYACNSALLCPDGCLRCSADFSLAKGLCDNIDYGSAKIYNPYQEQGKSLNGKGRKPLRSKKPTRRKR